MSVLTKLLPTDNILIDLDVSSKKRVFEQAGLLFENSQGLARSLVFDSLFSREKIGSTGLGHGIAIPHGRIKGLREATAAFIRTRTPIPFDAPDAKPVNLIFVLLVPEKANDYHLQIISELAHLFSDKNFRDRLAVVDDISELHQLLTGQQSNVSGQHPSTV